MILRNDEILPLDPNLGLFNRQIKIAQYKKTIGLDQFPIERLDDIATYFSIGRDLFYQWRTRGIPYPRIEEVSKKLGISEELLLIDSHAIKKYNRLHDK